MKRVIVRTLSYFSRSAAAGFFLMLLLGILHNDFTNVVPALGFWVCFGIMLCVLGVTSAVATDAVSDIDQFRESLDDL